MSEKYRLLHVDDDQMWQYIVRDFLSQTCDITACSSIAEALSALSSGKVFDIAAVDLTLDISGDEWEVKTPEDLICVLKDIGIGVMIFSAVPDEVGHILEQKLGVKSISKGYIDDYQEIVNAALWCYSNFQE